MTSDAAAWAVEIGLLGFAFLCGTCSGSARGRAKLAKAVRKEQAQRKAYQADRVARWMQPPVPVAWDETPFALLSAYEDATVNAAQYRAHVGYSTDDEGQHVAVAQQLSAQSAQLRAQVLKALGDDPAKITAFYAGRHAADTTGAADSGTAVDDGSVA